MAKGSLINSLKMCHSFSIWERLLTDQNIIFEKVNRSFNSVSECLPRFSSEYLVQPCVKK